MSKRKRVVLLDAHSIIHRAYHALPDFSNSKGEPTGALYGLLSMLLSIIKDLNPDYIFAAYDLPGKTQRHEIYKDYKAGRKKADKDLLVQLKKSRELLKSFAIDIFDKESYEADDILGSLAEKMKTKYDVIVASGDLDLLQVVDDKKVRVFTLKRSIKDTILYDREAVEQRFSFGPEFIVDYKALKGDPSDNIPGVSGIGDKTATELILQFGHIEDIYSVLEQNEDALKKAGFKDRVIKLLKEGKEEAFFSKALATIEKNLDLPLPDTSKSWREKLNWSLAVKLLYELEFRSLIPRFEALIEDKERVKRAADNIDTNSLEFKETSIALWLVRSDIINPSLEDIYAFSGTQDFQKARQIIFKVLKERNLQRVFDLIERPLIPTIDKMNKTGILLDLKYFANLSKDYHKKIDKLKKEIYKLSGEEFNINSPLQLSEILFDKLKINPKSLKKTQTGRYSTQESELEKIKNEHPIIDKILSYREFAKLLSTYIDNLPRMIKDDGRLHTEFIQAGTSTGRLASRNPNLQNIPIKTELGRAVRYGFIAEEGYTLASFDYSQIELRIAAILSGDELLIKAFSENKDIHSFVASQIFDVDEKDVGKEMRRKAKVINFGIIYGMGANALKQNLGLDSVKEAREYLDKFFKKHKGLAKWIDKTKAGAARKGYTETLFGRRRYFDGINSDIPYIRAAAERMAINAPIQGTQADIIKLAMQKIDKMFDSLSLENDARMLLQVHDELIFEIKKSRLEELKIKIKDIMENILDKDSRKSVPIVVDSSVGDSWGELY